MGPSAVATARYYGNRFELQIVTETALNYYGSPLELQGVTSVSASKWR